LNPDLILDIIFKNISRKEAKAQREVGKKSSIFSLRFCFFA